MVGEEPLRFGRWWLLLKYSAAVMHHYTKWVDPQKLMRLAHGCGADEGNIWVVLLFAQWSR